MSEISDTPAPKRIGRGDVIIVLIVVVVVTVLAGGLFYRMRVESRKKQLNSIYSHLQFIRNGAFSYMQAKNVTQVAITDIAGTDFHNSYILEHDLQPVVDEDYSHLVITSRQSQISITSATFGTLTYNF